MRQYASFSGAFVRDRDGVQLCSMHYVMQPKPALTDFDLCRYYANTWITTHLLTPEGWKAELT